jgi:hypothetical protein
MNCQPSLEIYSSYTWSAPVVSARGPTHFLVAAETGGGVAKTVNTPIQDEEFAGRRTISGADANVISLVSFSIRSLFLLEAEATLPVHSTTRPPQPTFDLLSPCIQLLPGTAEVFWIVDLHLTVFF